MIYDVFISHSTRASPKEHSFVDKLDRELKYRGLKVFMDRSCLRNGEDIFLRLKQAIKCSCLGIIVLTASYLESPWGELEIAEMLKQKSILRMNLMALRLEENCRIPKKISDIEVINCFYPYDIESIADRIVQACNKE